MKAIEITSEREETFGNLVSGTAFMDKDGDLFMKFSPTCDADDADNAVNIKAGYGCRFNSDEKVVLVDAKIVMFQR